MDCSQRDPNFAVGREKRFLLDVVDSARGASLHEFADHCWNYDFVDALDPFELALLQVVSERHSPVSRIDNLFSSWRRTLGKELQLPKPASLKRATWTAIGADNIIVDVRVMHDVFDAATAKLWAEIAGAADATRCSYIEPAMPPQLQLPDKPRVASGGPVVGHAAQRPPQPPSKTVQLSGPAALVATTGKTAAFPG